MYCMNLQNLVFANYAHCSFQIRIGNLNDTDVGYGHQDTLGCGADIWTDVWMDV